LKCSSASALHGVTVIRSKVMYVLVLLLAGFLAYMVNPWVYAFKPIHVYVRDPFTGKLVVLAEYECVGFIIPQVLHRDVRVTPGDLVCYDEAERGVYESLRLTVNTVTGYWVYSDVVLLYINTTRSKYLEIVVEKPLETVNLTVILRNTRDKSVLLTFTLSEYERFLTSIPAGSYTLTLTLIVNATKPARGVFRVGFYIGSFE